MHFAISFILDKLIVRGYNIYTYILEDLLSDLHIPSLNDRTAGKEITMKLLIKTLDLLNSFFEFISELLSVLGKVLKAVWKFIYR